MRPSIAYLPPLLQLDLLAFGGYKFVGLVLNMLAGIFFGRLAYFAVRSG